MVNGKQIRSNAILSLVQVCVSAVSLFFVYRYLLHLFGAEKMGVWSIVMTFATLAKIGDFGFAGGITKFVAKYDAIGDTDAMHQIVDTGIISLACLFSAATLIVFPVAKFVLPMFIKQDVIPDALALLPFSLASFAISAIASVFLSALDGKQRVDFRNLIQMLGTLVYALFILLFTRREIFVSVGYAQLGQALTLLLAGWVTARANGVMPRFIPSRWHASRFKEMLPYNANLQASVLASLLLDPVTKLLLGRLGTLSMVGYFEMASKLVSQFRSVMVSVNQTLVPVIAQLKEKDGAQVASFYERTYSALFFVSLIFYTCAAVAIPLIAEMWLGSANHFFLFSAFLVLFAMFVNTLTGPAYFSNQGTGDVRMNTDSQLTMGFINVIFALAAGISFGGAGVIVAYGVAIVSGSLSLLFRFMKTHGMERRTILPSQSRSLATFCAAVFLLAAVTSVFFSVLLPYVRYGIIMTVLFSLLFFAARSPAFTEMCSVMRVKKG